MKNNKMSTTAKTIVLPTDFSDNARKAYLYAFTLYGFKDVRYILLNTYLLPFTRMDNIVPLSDTMGALSKNGLINELSYCQKLTQDNDLNMEYSSIYGDLEIVLESIVSEEKVDLIVMGTKGAAGLDKLLFGSNTARVVRNIPCPVLVVPTGAKIDAPERIAFAVDYEELTDQFELQALRDIAESYHSKVLVFNVLSENDIELSDTRDYKVNIHRTLTGIPHTFTSVEEDSVLEGIEEFVEDKDVQLLTMVAHQHNFFERLVHRSITKQIATSFKMLPILILPENDHYENSN